MPQNRIFRIDERTRIGSLTPFIPGTAGSPQQQQMASVAAPRAAEMAGRKPLCPAFDITLTDSRGTRSTVRINLSLSVPKETDETAPVLKEWQQFVNTVAAYGSRFNVSSSSYGDGSSATARLSTESPTLYGEGDKRPYLGSQLRVFIQNVLPLLARSVTIPSGEYYIDISTPSGKTAPGSNSLDGILRHGLVLNPKSGANPIILNYSALAGNKEVQAQIDQIVRSHSELVRAVESGNVSLTTSTARLESGSGRSRIELSQRASQSELVYEFRSLREQLLAALRIALVRRLRVALGGSLSEAQISALLPKLPANEDLRSSAYLDALAQLNSLFNLEHQDPSLRATLNLDQLSRISEITMRLNEREAKDKNTKSKLLTEFNAEAKKIYEQSLASPDTFNPLAPSGSLATTKERELVAGLFGLPQNIRYSDGQVLRHTMDTAGLYSAPPGQRAGRYPGEERRRELSADIYTGNYGYSGSGSGSLDPDKISGTLTYEQSERTKRERFRGLAFDPYSLRNMAGDRYGSRSSSEGGLDTSGLGSGSSYRLGSTEPTTFASQRMGQESRLEKIRSVLATAIVGAMVDENLVNSSQAQQRTAEVLGRLRSLDAGRMRELLSLDNGNRGSINERVLFEEFRELQGTKIRASDIESRVAGAGSNLRTLAQDYDDFVRAGEFQEQGYVMGFTGTRAYIYRGQKTGSGENVAWDFYHENEQASGLRRAFSRYYSGSGSQSSQEHGASFAIGGSREAGFGYFRDEQSQLGVGYVADSEKRSTSAPGVTPYLAGAIDYRTNYPGDGRGQSTALFGGLKVNLGNDPQSKWGFSGTAVVGAGNNSLFGQYRSDVRTQFLQELSAGKLGNEQWHSVYLQDVKRDSQGRLSGTEFTRRHYSRPGESNTSTSVSYFTPVWYVSASRQEQNSSKTDTVQAGVQSSSTSYSQRVVQSSENPNTVVNPMSMLSRFRQELITAMNENRGISATTLARIPSDEQSLRRLFNFSTDSKSSSGMNTVNPEELAKYIGGSLLSEDMQKRIRNANTRISAALSQFNREEIRSTSTFYGTASFIGNSINPSTPGQQPSSVHADGLDSATSSAGSAAVSGNQSYRLSAGFTGYQNRTLQTAAGPQSVTTNPFSYRLSVSKYSSTTSAELDARKLLDMKWKQKNDGNATRAPSHTAIMTYADLKIGTQAGGSSGNTFIGGITYELQNRGASSAISVAAGKLSGQNYLSLQWALRRTSRVSDSSINFGLQRMNSRLMFTIGVFISF